MKRATFGAAAVGVVLGALLTATPAQADPHNPNDPDYCGARESAFTCAARLQTPPTAGESAFLADIRGHVAGTDAQHLAAGRAICDMLPFTRTSYIVGETSEYLGISHGEAGQVLADAHDRICPAVQIVS